MNKEIKISQENALNAYNNASAEGKELLEHLLGKEVFMPKDITERIKTFDDVLHEVNRLAEAGDEDAAILLADYESNADNIKMKETVAYMKLCLIASALNEGWKPQFTTNEYRWFPWFELFTQKELDDMDDEKKSRVVLRSCADANTNGGVAFVVAGYDSSYTDASYGSRLAFKTQELAKYAGKQFLDIWADYVFKPKEK